MRVTLERVSNWADDMIGYLLPIALLGLIVVGFVLACAAVLAVAVAIIGKVSS